MLSRAHHRVASVPRFLRTVTSDPQFFNRAKELEVLGTRIREKGNFLNVQGPPDCGKSAFVARALDQFQEDPEWVGKPSIVRVDLRENAFNSVVEFTATMSRLFAPVHKRWAEAGGKGVQEAARGFLGLTSEQPDPSMAAAVGAAGVAAGAVGSALEKWGTFGSVPALTTVLGAVFKTTWKLHGGALHHVLWIDEANNLKKLLKMPGGEIALEQVLDAFLRWTKQERLVTIVLSSSESFYLNDIYKEAFVRVKDRIDPFCIGCFSEADARSFYDRLTADVGAAGHALLPPFEQAYEVVGGHPMHMRELVQRCLKEGLLQRGLIHLRPCVQYNYLLDTALGGGHDVGIGEHYSVQQLKVALRLIAKHGFVYRRELRAALEKAGASDPDATIKSLVYHNVLQYRPNTEQSYDLPDRIAERNVPVLSAPSPAALYNLRQAIRHREIT